MAITYEFPNLPDRFHIDLENVSLNCRQAADAFKHTIYTLLYRIFALLRGITSTISCSLDIFKNVHWIREAFPQTRVVDPKSVILDRSNISHYVPIYSTLTPSILSRSITAYNNGVAVLRPRLYIYENGLISDLVDTPTTSRNLESLEELCVQLLSPCIDVLN